MRDLTRPASVMTAILVVWTLAISKQTAQAELLDPAAVYTASYSTVAEQTPAPSGDATTTVGGNTFDLNAFLGADRYYSHATSISGQNTISTNLEAGVLLEWPRDASARGDQHHQLRRKSRSFLGRSFDFCQV